MTLPITVRDGRVNDAPCPPPFAPKGRKEGSQGPAQRPPLEDTSRRRRALEGRQEAASSSRRASAPSAPPGRGRAPLVIQGRVLRWPLATLLPPLRGERPVTRSSEFLAAHSASRPGH